MSLHYQSLDEVYQLLNSGELSSVELTQHMLARINKLDGELHSYACVLEEQALQQATQADSQRAQGEALGPLHGVPLAVKDLVFTKDIPTASGTKVMADFCPSFNGTVYQRMREAGAVIIGKTQLTEGAYGSHHPQITPPKNPYDANLWPGVSSSGSGVSVAAGLNFGALGSDTGGSIRFPSACCGLVGLKPTYGRVSRHGVFPLAESLDHVGPMTRSVTDAARILQSIAGFDPLDPTSSEDVVPDYLAHVSNTSLQGVTIGVDWQYITSGVEPAIKQLMELVIKQLTELGAQIQEVQLPATYEPLVHGWGITCGVETAQAHKQYYPSQRELYGPALSYLIELGLSVPQSHYDELQRVRQEFTYDLNKLFSQVDFLVAPCMPMVGPKVDEMERVATSDDNRAEVITFTAPFDYSGHPTLTLPHGLNDAGVPLSFQFIGPSLGEDKLLQIGAAYEAAVGQLPHPEI